MRRLCLTAALALAAAGANAGERPFLTALENVPVAPGLAEVAGAGLVFDTPGGRIAEAYARAGGDDPAGRAAVRRFYRDTLPQLGWRRTARGRYRREDEVLTLAFERRDGTLTVRFTITPAGAPGTGPGATRPRNGGDS